MDVQPEQSTSLPSEQVVAGHRGSKASKSIQRHPCVRLALIGIVLYLIAPWFTAFDLKNGTGYPGWIMLFFGWLEVLSVFDGRIGNIAWLSNPLFAIGTLAIFRGERKSAVALMMIAALCSIASFSMTEVPINEAGHTSAIVRHNIGFWLWLASIWTNLLVAIVVISTPIRAKSASCPLAPALRGEG